MKITNKLNLPEPIINAIKNDTYTSGDVDISITALLSPPRKTALESKYQGEIEEDASDKIWSLLGQSIHSILERSATKGIAERRLIIEIEGWGVSGGMDYYVPGTGLLQDYKIVTVYKFKNDATPMEYEQQLNMYAELLRQHEEPVNKLQIVGILRDWSKLEAMRDKNYPQSQVVVRDVKLWPQRQAIAFLRERVILHKKARLSLPECTPEERWQKPDMYAVYKVGGKRALRVFTSEEDAKRLVEENKGLIIQKRNGENTRCSHYCSVNKFCKQFLDSLAKTENLNNNATDAE
jgi:hypothetical protein